MISMLCLRGLYGISVSFVLGRSFGLSPYAMNSDEQFTAVILYMIAHTELLTSREASDFTALLLCDLVHFVQDLGLTCGSIGRALLIDRGLSSYV